MKRSLSIWLVVGLAGVGIVWAQVGGTGNTVQITSIAAGGGGGSGNVTGSFVSGNLVKASGANSLVDAATGTGVVAAIAINIGSPGSVVTTNNIVTMANKTMSDAVNSVTTPTTTSVGYLGTPQHSFSANFTTVLTDSGKQFYHAAADTNNRTITIDSNANVAAPIGTQFQVVNPVNTLTITVTSDTLQWFTGNGTIGTGNRTVSAAGVATISKVDTTTWVISGPGVN